MKRYKVSGFAMVPVKVEMFIHAKNEKTARNAALSVFAKDPSRHVQHRSEDYEAAHEWQPHVEEAS